MMINPGKEERTNFNKITTEFLEKLNAKLKDAKVILGGSGAKDTWLSGNHDIDLFVQYDYKKYSSESEHLSELLEKTLKKTFPKVEINKLHGSRDYFQLTYKKLNFEVVPIIKISKSEDALNITDISPLHAIWVNKNTKDKKDDIRLVKQLCRANKLYGAESYISGFSGYILEILIAHYGSFEKLLKASEKWKDKEVVDPEKHYKNKAMVMFNLNTSKLQSPLIIVDPVDQNRNAAAALSLEKFMLFKKVAKSYLKKPSATFFTKKEIDLEQLNKEKGNLVYVKVIPLEGKGDVVGVKLLKAFEFLEKEFKPFGVKKSDWDWDREKKAVFYYILEKDKLPDYDLRKGPPLKLEDFVKDFKKKNKDTFVKEGKLYAKIKVEYPLLKDFVNDLIKQKYFKEKVKKIELII